MDDRKFGVYVTRDLLAQRDAVPWCSANDRTAVRAFQHSLRESPYPHDYQLLRIGYVLSDQEEYSLFPDQTVIFDKNGQHVDIMEEDFNE